MDLYDIEFLQVRAGKIKIKSKGFGVKGSGFYGRSKGQIKSPYGTKVVESDPEREIKLYPLKRLFNQAQKEISSIDLKSCNSSFILFCLFNYLFNFFFFYLKRFYIKFAD